MYSIEQLEAFVATVETGSFSSAARSLHKAQSVVSQHVINLEIDCNASLFDRSGRYPQLTSAGKKLLPHAQVLLAQHQRLRYCAQTLTPLTALTYLLGVEASMTIILQILDALMLIFLSVGLAF